MFTRVVSGLVIALASVAFGTLASAAEDVPAHGDAHAAAPAEHATAEHAGDDDHGGGDINPLGFKADLAIWTGVVFLVLMLVLWKFAWGPLAAGLDKREQGIADQIAQAEKANQEARELLAQYEQQLADAKDEVRGIVEAGRNDAERIGQEIVEKAKQEGAAEQQRTLRQIDSATATALKELAEKGARLAVELAGRIVRAELKPSDHAGLIDRTLSDFAAEKPGANGTNK